MTNLKPCPFCGGEAKFLIKCHMDRGITRGYNFGICCTKCGISTTKTNYGIELQLNSNGEIETTLDERPLAVEAWNRRVNDDKDDS